MTQNQDSCRVSELELADVLHHAGFDSVRRLVVAGPLEISRAEGLSLDKSVSIYNWAHTKLEADSIIHKASDTADKFYTNKKNRHRISTGSRALNRLLGDGIETGAVTEFYGASGCGKTQLCFTLSVMAQQPIYEGGLDGKVIYVDTEHKFSPERILQITSTRGFNTSEILHNILLFQPFDSSQQEKNIQDLAALLEKDNKIKLVIVDSIISHYRSEFVGRESLPERQHRLYKSVRMMSNIAEIYNVAVVITNQIQSSPDYGYGDKRASTGGNVLAHASTHRIELRCNRMFYGIAKIVNSPCRRPSEEKFMISEEGISDEDYNCSEASAHIGR